MTIVLSIQGYYITDFGAFALEFRGSVHTWDGNRMVGGIHGSGGWNCLRALKRAKGTHKGCPCGKCGAVCVGPGWALRCLRWMTLGTRHDGGWGGKSGRSGSSRSYYGHTRCGGRFRGGVAGAEPPHKGGPTRPDRPEKQGLGDRGQGLVFGRCIGDGCAGWTWVGGLRLGAGV